MMKPLVIRASAGTGKTYRLSLEFINLLLKYRIEFEEILVITFTKKATAEIRERIFSQLHQLLYDQKTGEELKQNFRTDINPDIKFNSEEITFLSNVYRKMITAKSSVKISTIDSFVNNVFSGIIAPFNNILEFKIDNKINREILPEIFERVLHTDRIESYKQIFLEAKRRNLDQFHQFILDIIENRWLFEFIDQSQLLSIDLETERENTLFRYQDQLTKFLNLLQSEIIKKDTAIDYLLQKQFKISLISHIDLFRIEKTDFAQKLFTILIDPQYLSDNLMLLLDNKNIWNGVKIKNNELKDFFIDLQASLADYIYYDKAFIEQLNIISLAAEVLQAYDEIKFRDKIFTHSDISYYTFRFLYDPDLSIIDKENVMNIFYEQLSYNTRFVLIDEFQDTSIIQWSIFKPILKEILSGIGQKDYGNVIVVGDEKQAIYGWRGGERKLLTNFEKILNFPVRYDSLETSYRSKPILMTWLNRLFGSQHLNFVASWDYTNINCHKTSGGFVQVNFRNKEKLDNIQEKMSRSQVYQEFIQNILKVHLDSHQINPADTAILMRKNDELKDMALTLEEAGIDYILDTSGSIFHHRAIRPIMYILRFLVYEDIYELIKFLRSDLILIYPEELRDIIQRYNSASDLDKFLQTETSHSFIQSLYKLRSEDRSIQQNIKLILEEFNFADSFNSEIDLKNIFRYIEVAAEFERSNHEYPIDLTGFLNYCHALEEKDEYSQIGQTVSDSIKLLTIHKSKGLQFETVFTLLDVTSSGSNRSKGLNFYYDFAENYTRLEDYAITYNFDRVLRRSKKSDLVNTVEDRFQGDELNNIYVALTRAKNNLFIYLHYNKKGDLEKFIGDLKEDSSILKHLSKTIFLEFQDELKENSPVEHSMNFGEISSEPSQPKNKVELIPDLAEKIQIFNIKDAQKGTKIDIHKIRKEILENQSIQTGNIVHEYLSHIKYDTLEDRQRAMNMTIAKYGNLFKQDRIKYIVAQVDQFLDGNTEIFNQKNWDRVFNEFVVFDKDGHEFRIDRLMINTKDKRIMIVDYKTGKHYDQEQLDRYKEILETLPIVRKDNFVIKTEFLEIILAGRINNE